MASTFAGSESYSTGPTVTDTTYFSHLVAALASGSDGTTVPNANPVVVPASSYAYSYERWVRAHWTGTFSSITSVYYWKNAGTLPGSSKVKCKVKTPNPTTYVTAIVTASTYAGTAGNEGNTTNDIPTATGGLNPLYASNYSDYLIMQLVVPSGTASGNVSDHVYRFGWNEV